MYSYSYSTVVQLKEKYRLIPNDFRFTRYYDFDWFWLYSQWFPFYRDFRCPFLQNQLTLYRFRSATDCHFKCGSGSWIIQDRVKAHRLNIEIKSCWKHRRNSFTCPFRFGKETICLFLRLSPVTKYIFITLYANSKLRNLF